MTGYRQTSLMSYLEALQGLNEKQKRVYLTIAELVSKQGKCNDKQIAKALTWPINTVTPRRLELLELKKIVEAGPDKDPESKRTVNFWRIVA